MNIQQYLDQKKSIQNFFLEFLSNDSNIEESYQNLIKSITNLNILKNIHELERLIYLIIAISKNHHHFPNFFDKIEKIILYLKKDIAEKFSATEIFKLFKGNKRILLFLLKENILILQKSIVDLISEKFNYSDYFLPEIISFSDKEIDNKITDLNDFEKKRKVGENDDILSEMIRKDSIDKFISYVNQKNMSLNLSIKTTIFETNSFLLQKEEHSLIEYAAFFGSVQIFKYLHLNGVKLTENLCLYAIHGYNPELIHYLEKNKIFTTEKFYKKALIESIKCHHNEIANYIQYNLLNNNLSETDLNTIDLCLKYSNYSFFPKNLSNELTFYYLCKYNYITIINILLSTKSIDINKKVVF